MTDSWWYAEGGARKGPVALERLHELMLSAEIDSSTLVWKLGQDGWKPLGQVQDLSNILAALPPELPAQIPLDLPPEPPPDLPGTPAVAPAAPTQPPVVPAPPSEGLPNPAAADAERLPAAPDAPPTSSTQERWIHEPLATPWRRFSARIFDLWFLSMAVGAVVVIAGSHLSDRFALWIDSPSSTYPFGWLLLPLVLLVEACIYAITGSTPGKGLLAVKVLTLRSNRLSFAEYLRRQVGVYWYGLATGFPFVNLFTMAMQRTHLQAGKSATYDQGKFIVKAPPLSGLRTFFAVVAAGALFALYVTLQVINKEDEHRYIAGFDWTNPTTQKVAKIPPGWTHNTQKTDTGDEVHVFGSDQERAYVVFAGESSTEPLGLQGYFGVWVDAVASTMALTKPAIPATIAGKSSLTTTGWLVQERSQKVDAAVFLRGDREYWRVVIVNISGEPPVTEGTRKLREALLGTL